MPTTMVPQTTGQTPPDTGVWDKGVVAHPAHASKLFGCTPAAVADVLDRAADRIHRLGLWQGEGKSAGRTCVVLALNDITGKRGGQLLDAALDSLAAHLHLTATDPGAADLVLWNDTPGRTSAEVCGEMRACAAGLRITSDASGYRTVTTGVTA
jgi:hypothetical protein